MWNMNNAAASAVPPVGNCALNTWAIGGTKSTWPSRCTKGESIFRRSASQNGGALKMDANCRRQKIKSKSVKSVTFWIHILSLQRAAEACRRAKDEQTSLVPKKGPRKTGKQEARAKNCPRIKGGLNRGKMLSPLVLCVAIAVVGNPARAQIIAVSVQEIFASSEWVNSGQGRVSDMISGSGMQGNDCDGVAGWPGVERAPPSEWIAASVGYQCEWQSGGLVSGGVNSKIGWVILDLGSSHKVEDLFFWNGREQTAPNRAVKSFSVYRTNGPLTGVTTLQHGPTTATAIDYSFSSPWIRVATNLGPFVLQTNTTVYLGSQQARYVGIEILSNNGDSNRVGIAELAVTAVAPVTTAPATTAPATTAPATTAPATTAPATTGVSSSVTATTTGSTTGSPPAVSTTGPAGGPSTTQTTNTPTSTGIPPRNSTASSTGAGTPVSSSNAAASSGDDGGSLVLVFILVGVAVAVCLAVVAVVFFVVRRRKKNLASSLGDSESVSLSDADANEDPDSIYGQVPKLEAASPSMQTADTFAEAAGDIYARLPTADGSFVQGSFLQATYSSTYSSTSAVSQDAAEQRASQLTGVTVLDSQNVFVDGSQRIGVRFLPVFVLLFLLFSKLC
jgi:hypothetical protein